jgi:hypothetical protein
MEQVLWREDLWEIKTQFFGFSNFFDIVTFYEIMWIAFVERGWTQMEIWCIGIESWKLKAIKEH